MAKKKRLFESGSPDALKEAQRDMMEHLTGLDGGEVPEKKTYREKLKDPNFKKNLGQMQDVEQYLSSLANFLRGWVPIVEDDNQLYPRFNQIFNALKEILDLAPPVAQGFHYFMFAKTCLEAIKYDPKLDILSIRYITLLMKSSFNSFAEYMRSEGVGHTIDESERFVEEQAKREQQAEEKKQALIKDQKKWQDEHHSKVAEDSLKDLGDNDTGF